MAKKHLYFDEAERMYVYEQMTLAEIASRLNISERSLSDWKAEGNWDEKRQQYLQNRQSFHEELYQFARALMRSIMKDIENGEKIDAGRLYAFTRIIPNIVKIKDYEEVLNQHKDEQKGITEDVLKVIESEILGIR